MNSVPVRRPTPAAFSLDLLAPAWRRGALLLCLGVRAVMRRYLALFYLVPLLGCPAPQRPPASGSSSVDTLTVDSTGEVWGPEIEADPSDTLVGLSIVPGLGLMAAPAPEPGLRGGGTQWKPTNWCGGLFTATTLAGTPKLVGGLLRTAARCGVGVAFTFPRRLMTSNGQTNGPFSLARAKALVDELARYLPPDTVRKYTASRTLIYLSALDDMGCARCWGGTAISKATTAEVTKYAQLKLGEAPIGLRVTPDWMAGYTGWEQSVDVAVAQYHTRKTKLGQAAWYDKERSLMDRVGVAKMVYAVNVEDCHGVNSSPCDAAELRQYGQVAVDYPGNCAFLNFKYDEATLSQPGVRDAWLWLIDRARAKDRRTCARE